MLSDSADALQGAIMDAMAEYLLDVHSMQLSG